MPVMLRVRYPPAQPTTADSRSFRLPSFIKPSTHCLSTPSTYIPPTHRRWRTFPHHPSIHPALHLHPTHHPAHPQRALRTRTTHITRPPHGQGAYSHPLPHKGRQRISQPPTAQLTSTTFPLSLSLPTPLHAPQKTASSHAQRQSSSPTPTPADASTLPSSARHSSRPHAQHTQTRAHSRSYPGGE